MAGVQQEKRYPLLLPAREPAGSDKGRRKRAGGRSTRMRTVTFQPRGAAQDLLRATDSEICIAGPAGTGKSLVALWKLHLTCLAVPGVQALMARQTHISLTGTTINLFERAVIKSALEAGIISWYGGSSRQPAAYRYANGSTIIVGGLDQPTKFLSAELDIILVDEATEISKTAFETLVSRLRGVALRHKQIILACNPSHPRHWIKQRCDAGSMRMIVSRHIDNPLYYRPDGQLTELGEEYVIGKLHKLTGVRRLRLLKGIWASAEGVIYEEWDDAIHIADHPPMDQVKNWTTYWAVDFGFVNPFCWQLWGMDPDGGLWRLKEVYHTKRRVSEHCELIRKVSAGYPDPTAVICDHDAESRATLEAELGFSPIPANKNVADGLQAVKERLVENRIRFCKNGLVERDPDLDQAMKPACTEEEIPGYVWMNKGRRVEEGELKDEPLKENDHGADATRYTVMFVDKAANPGVRWL